nr:BAG family molecular chaperone regulator 7 [Ipomoea batatas]
MYVLIDLQGKKWRGIFKSPEEDGLDRAYKWVAEIKDGKKGAVEKSYKVSAEIKGKGEDSPISRTYTFKTTSGKNAGEKEEDGDNNKKKKKKKKAVSCARVVEIEEPSDHGAIILRQVCIILIFRIYCFFTLMDHELMFDLSNDVNCVLRRENCVVFICIINH